MRSSTIWLFQLIQLTSLTSASDANWTKPNSGAPSFTDTYTVGERIYVSWLTLNNSVNDLWLTRYDTSVDNFSARLALNQNISISSNYEWTISVNQSEVQKDTRFILQFLPAGSAYDPSEKPKLPSPPFNLIALNQQSPPNGTQGAPSLTPNASVTSTSGPIVSSDASSHLPSSSPPPGPSGPPLSRNVAIGVALVAAVIVLVTMLGSFFMIRKYKRPKPVEAKNDEEFKATGPYEVLGSNKQPMELSSKETGIHELNSSQETIVYESDSSVIHEMSNTIKKPGLHELPG